jgi:hypothetical protein
MVLSVVPEACLKIEVLVKPFAVANERIFEISGMKDKTMLN